MKKDAMKNGIRKMLILALVAGLTLGDLSVFAEEASIKDLDKSSGYARPAIVELANRRIINGDDKGNFNPAQNITRGQMIIILARVLELDFSKPPAIATFKDVPKSHWAFAYVEAAYKAGIVSGVAKDRFGINELCSREQLAVMFVRALKISDKDLNSIYGAQKVNDLTDKSKISSWAKGSVDFALVKGLMAGTSSKTFGPKEYAKREQAAVVTYNFINNKDNITALPPQNLALDAKNIAALQNSVVNIKNYDKVGNFMKEGSGFAVGKGLFLTSYHVVEGGSKHTIKDNAGKIYEVQGIVKYDPDLDLAIIKTKEPTTLTALKLGSKSNVSKAASVISIGYLQGSQNTVSSGIVSAQRSFEYGKSGILNLIQTTAAMSETSKGSPLIDMTGSVIGIMASSNEDGNIRFAVAIDHVKAWVQELQAKSFTSISVMDISKSNAGYEDFSEAGIKAFMYKMFRAREAGTVTAYMSTLHPLMPAYRDIQLELQQASSHDDKDYNILEMNVIERSHTEAEVEVIYNLGSPSGHNSYDDRVYGRYMLLKRDGQWKLYYIAESKKGFENEVRYDTGIGGISKEESLWAYEQQKKELQTAVPANAIPLDFKPSAVIVHPVKPIIYASDKEAKKVYAYNVETGQHRLVQFQWTPDSLAIAGSEIYVGLLKGSGSEAGAIAIIDSETLQLKEQFDIGIVPLDIVPGRDGYIYVTPGYGGSGAFKSYSRSTLKETSSYYISRDSYAELHPVIDNKIYVTDNVTSPRRIAVYEVLQGKFLGYPTNSDVPTTLADNYKGSKFMFSPEGNYFITTAGSIFASKDGTAKYVSNLGRAFVDAVFVKEANSLFTGIQGGYVYQYDYPGFDVGETYKVQGEIQKLYYHGGKLMALTKINDKFYIETVAIIK